MTSVESAQRRLDQGQRHQRGRLGAQDPGAQTHRFETGGPGGVCLRGGEAALGADQQVHGGLVTGQRPAKRSARGLLPQQQLAGGIGGAGFQRRLER